MTTRRPMSRRGLIVLCIVAAFFLTLLLLAVGSPPSPDKSANTVSLTVSVATEGGAGVLGDLAVGGEKDISNIRARHDLRYHYNVAHGSGVVATFVRYPNRGRLRCTITADGKTLFTQTTNESDDTCDIVLIVK